MFTDTSNTDILVRLFVDNEADTNANYLSIEKKTIFISIFKRELLLY